MNRITLFLIAAPLTLVAGFFGGQRYLGWFADDAGSALAGASVRRGPLRISVLESGNLRSANSVEIMNELEGSSTVLFLIDEGQRVEPGELLIELDATELQERKVSQEIVVQTARSEEIKAKQSLEIQRSQNESDIAEALRNLEFAAKDLKKYEEGDWPQELQAARDDILLAEEELKRAQDKLTWSEQLQANGFLTRTELEADQLAHQRSTIQLAQANRALELLEEYDYPRQVQSLTADVQEAEREKRRVELQAVARIVDEEADLLSATGKLRLEEEKLARLDEQIGKAKIYAPVAGMVVYHKEGGGRYGGGGDQVEEGMSVRERQKLITIPSSTEMQVQAAIHESVLEQVQVDQDVLVQVDALPDRTFRGRVRYKAPLPDQNAWWSNPDLRVYRTDVDILDPDPAMRPGMTCQIEVVVAELKDVNYVPVQSVYLNKGETVAFVSKSGTVELRPVVLGQHNEAWVEIKAGLEEGEVVLLSQPEGYQCEAVIEEPVLVDEQAEPKEGGPRGAEGPGGERAKQSLDPEAQREKSGAVSGAEVGQVSGGERAENQSEHGGLKPAKEGGFKPSDGAETKPSPVQPNGTEVGRTRPSGTVEPAGTPKSSG